MPSSGCRNMRQISATTTGLISSGISRIEIVDILEARHRVQHQRDREADQELEKHHRDDELQRHPDRLAEIVLGESRCGSSRCPTKVSIDRCTSV